MNQHEFTVTQIHWTTLDFRPGGEGYRSVRLALPGLGITFTPVIGWLIQEEHRYRDGQLIDDAPRERRIVPGVLTRDGIERAGYVLAPGDPEPTAADLFDERGRRARRQTVA
jgi:hypothetical protein